MSKSRKLLNLVGPYPYSPGLLFLTIFLCLASRYQITLYDLPVGSARVKASLSIFFLAAGPGVIVALMTFLFTKFRRWSKDSLIFYVFEIAFIIFVLRIARYFSQQNPLWKSTVPENAWLPTTWVTLLGALVFGLLINGFINFAQKATVGKLAEATELVNKLSEKHELLIGADEQVREQTSRFLHDRVQSDLMVVGMNLKSISGQSSTEVNEVIEKAITRLEKTRTNDLRDLVQILTPNFEIGGIKEALSVLAVQYQDGMKIFTEIDDKSERLSSKELLGAFRIIEQSLINALMHGPATQVLISLKTNESGVSELTVSDNGPGINLSDVTAGTGTAIIDSWVGILNGKKTVDTVPGHGYRLVINFPISS
jgi:signal transduction histidine kinase